MAISKEELQQQLIQAGINHGATLLKNTEILIDSLVDDGSDPRALAAQSNLKCLHSLANKGLSLAGMSVTDSGGGTGGK